MVQNVRHGTKLIRQANTYKKLPEEKRKHHHKEVQVIDAFGNVLNEFKSVREAAKYYGIDGSSISKCCRGGLITCGGRHWRYKK